MGAGGKAAKAWADHSLPSVPGSEWVQLHIYYDYNPLQQAETQLYLLIIWNNEK